VNLSTALQVALLVASTAFVLLVAFLIPVVFRAQRQVERLVVAVGEVKSDLDVLVDEGRELVGNVNTLVERVNVRVRDAEQIVGTVRRWAGNVDLVRTGVTALLRGFSNRNHRGKASRRTTEENEHA